MVQSHEANLRYCRFWFNGKICDAYLKTWTETELKQPIQRGHGSMKTKIWKDNQEFTGAIQWDDQNWIVTEEKTPPPDYPKLWKWEVSWESNEVMLVSPSHPVADAKVSINKFRNQ
jgi:hypothetical protein